MFLVVVFNQKFTSRAIRGDIAFSILWRCFFVECFSVLVNFFVLLFLGFIVRVFSSLRFDDGLGGFGNGLLLNYTAL